MAPTSPSTSSFRRPTEEWQRWKRNGAGQACQTEGTAALTAKELFNAEAKIDSKRYEEPGKRARLVLRAKPTADDLPDEALDEEVWLNMVGTFGVASAGYWWGRAGAAIMRLGHYFVGYHDALWTLLYSDDGKLTGRTAHPERGLLLFHLVIVLVRLPLSWHKVRGGKEVEWIGYLLDVGRFEMGALFMPGRPLAPDLPGRDSQS